MQEFSTIALAVAAAPAIIIPPYAPGTGHQPRLVSLGGTVDSSRNPKKDAGCGRRYAANGESIFRALQHECAGPNRDAVEDATGNIVPGMNTSSTTAATRTSGRTAAAPTSVCK